MRCIMCREPLSAVTQCRVSGCDPAWQFFSTLYSGGTVIRCVTCALLAGWTNIRKHPRSHSISISLLLGSSHYTNSFGENTIEFVFLNLLQFTFFFKPFSVPPNMLFFPQLNFRSIFELRVLDLSIKKVSSPSTVVKKKLRLKNWWNIKAVLGFHVFFFSGWGCRSKGQTAFVGWVERCFC